MNVLSFKAGANVTLFSLPPNISQEIFQYIHPVVLKDLQTLDFLSEKK